ncbi:RNA-dependent RNA polymerase [Soldado virus]|uniref:RNA-directed RNA polymerase L n=1 Tax=Soldado virus TaxID=426791 RepID=A0A191KWD1_9VIRU|nr:RNA-dependent RNA polymerase [Soldado virus]AMT75425.1 RNA-dependent RNA polymerase [Soldado virus]
MDDIVWQPLSPGLYTSWTRICVHDFFNINKVRGDGNCFFRSFALLFLGSEDQWRAVKNTAINYARANWTECTMAKDEYNGKARAQIKKKYSDIVANRTPPEVMNRDGLALYLEDALEDGYWGGSNEAQMLARALGVSIVLWNVNNDYKVTNVERFGDKPVSASFNLLLIGGHFDAMTLQGQIKHTTEHAPNEPTISIIEAIAPVEEELEDTLVDIVESPREESVVSLFHTVPDLETTKDLRQQLFSRKKAIEQRKVMAKAIEQQAHVPIKVGRALHKIFNCNVELSFSDKVIFLLPEGANDSNLIPLSRLRHNLLNKDGELRAKFRECVLVPTNALLKFVNMPELLRMAVPDTGISQFYDIVHPAYLYDLLTIALSVLFSTFLYGTDFKQKKKFIMNNVRSRYVRPSNVPKLLKEYNNFRLYQSPEKAVNYVCSKMYAELSQTLSKCLREMPAAGLLALRNLSLDSVEYQDYIQILDDLKVVSYDLDFFNQDELQEIKRLVDYVELTRKCSELTIDTDAIHYGSCYLGVSKESLFKDSKDKKFNVLRKDAFERKLIQHFFKKKFMNKFVTLQGKAYSGGSLSNVLAYCNNLYLTKEQLGFSAEDTEHLSAEMVRLRSMLDDQKVEPIALICDQLEGRFQNLFRELPKVCADECKTLFDDVRNAESHSSAWKSALRLKGIAYEGFMARAYSWNYLCEEMKPTLSMLIQVLYPDKFLQFLERTQLCPEQRDLTPDFAMTQKLSIKKDKIESSVETEQLQLQYKDDGSSTVIPVAKKTFPLPMEPIMEINRIDSVLNQFKKLQESKGRETGLLIESTPIERTEEELLSYSELLILEVGYQTDVEGKVVSDMQKWKSVISLLNFLGIKASVISCADSSEISSDNWWLPERYVKLLKSSISHLFLKLQQNSPSDVTDIVVGAISTQKIRSIIRAGTTVKTPVTIKDIRDVWKKQKEKILYRPTGEVIPEQLEEPFRLSLVDGIVQEKGSTDTIVKMIEENMEKIAQEVEQTKFKHVLNREEVTADELLLGWLLEDLSCCRCNTCNKNIREMLKAFPDDYSRLSWLYNEINYKKHPDCCHQQPITVPLYSLFQTRTGFLNAVEHKETVLDEFEAQQTSLDKLVKLTLPGKTERERKVKRCVEQLIRISMELSNIKCVKTSSFQLIIVDRKKTEKNVDKKGKRTEKLKEQLQRLEKTLNPKRLATYSDYCKEVISEVLMHPSSQKGCKSQIKDEWVERIFQDLRTETEDGAIIETIKKGIEEKRSFIVNNDKVLIPDWDATKLYLDAKADDLLKRGKQVFNLDCIIFKETVLECISRYFQTPYWDCPETLCALVKFMLKFQWYQKVVLYGKVCETFLQCCTEFRRSGIKLTRIRHTTANLVIKLPSNKKENMKCIIYDENMNPLCKPFFLNRRVAVLGASYYYILVVLFCQCLQHYRCISAVSDEEKLVEDVKVANATHLDALSNQLKTFLAGNIRESSDSLIELCRKNGNFLQKGTRSHFITVFSGLSITYSTLLGDALLTNSQPFNKQIQMMRFGVLNGLSRMSSTSELGKKFSSSCRRVEMHVARFYQQLVVYTCNRFPESNIKSWLMDDLCPKSILPSLSIYGHFINSDRQLVFDIYNVHIYNKEMDNFDEGTIKVLEETAERHMTWEVDLASAIKKIKMDAKKTRNARLLLGIANVRQSDTSEVVDEDETLSSTSYSSARSSSASKKRIKSYFGIMSMNKKPFSYQEDFVVERAPHSDYIQTISDKWTFGVYKAKPESVLRDVIEIIRKNPNHTMGSFELIQAFTEFARPKYPSESIVKAKRNPKNYITVSEVTETTSIVSEPRTHANIKDNLRTITGQENKKLVKMLRGKLQSLGLSLQATKVKSGDLTEMLSSVTSLSDHQKDMIIKGVTEPSKLTFYSWREVVEMKIETALITSDGNYIYCWLKSLGMQVKRSLKKFIKNLRYDNEFYNPKYGKEMTALVGEAAVQQCEMLIDNLKSLTKNELPKYDEIDPDILTTVWAKFVTLPKFFSDIVGDSYTKVNKVEKDLKSLLSKYRELLQLKNDYPTLSFSREEVELRVLENKFIIDYNSELMKLMNLVFYICLCCPWCVHYKSLENFLSKHMDETGGYDFGNATVSKVMDITLEGVWKLVLKQNFNIDADLDLLRFVVKYTSAMFTGNGRPISCSLSNQSSTINVLEHGQMVDKLRIFLTKSQLYTKELDFIWTCHMITNSNFEVTKRLTGRTTGERLPRSVRSKVVYEIIKVVGESGHAILQQLAFSGILNVEHEFFAVLAPKAQLGGHRDLLVQETYTKLIHAASEMFSRTLLATTNDDGLTTAHLKENILCSALNCIDTSRRTHGATVEDNEKLKHFYKVFCISGDNTKWGPIHCCSFFSGMMQQLLKDHPDWSSFYKLVFLKNLYRQVEIPAGSIKKILNAFRFNNANRKIEEMNEFQLRTLLVETIDSWNENPIIKFLVVTYLAQGKVAMRMYNHMGQGIHHATSSILTSIMGDVITHFIKLYIQKNFKGLTAHVEHAGSSDDYAKIIVVSGVIPKPTFENYEKQFWPRMCRLKNIIAGISRACQMKDSAKTLAGDAFIEFYSEFMLSHRITPAVIKFIFTGLINSSVTSPQSMSQACQVSSQQAMYNSVPLLTNFAFTLLRQQMFMNHTEYFQRTYGLMTMGSLSAFGRLYLPQYSNLTCSSIAIEDSETIVQNLSLIQENYLGIPDTKNFEEELEIEDSEGSPASVSSIAGGTPSSKLSAATLASDTSLRLSQDKVLTAVENAYLNTIKPQTSRLRCIAEMEVYQKIFGSNEPVCFNKFKMYSLCQSCEFLREAIDLPWLQIQRVRAILILLIAGYYRTFNSDGTERPVKANLNRDENTVIEDPMIQLIPEKLRRELERLGLAKMSVEELIPTHMLDDDFASLVSKRLVMMNCATENYASEVARLKQTLNSRNVIHGLAGGIKELSIPIYTIFLKSYFFKDNVFFRHHDRWNTKHSSNYRDSSGKELKDKIVIKYVTWLEKFLACDVSLDHDNTHKYVSLFDVNLKGISVIHMSNGSCELSIQTNQVEVLKQEFQALALQFSDVNRHKLKVLESQRQENVIEASKAVIVKTTLFSATDAVRISNSPAVVIGYMINESTLSEVKPTKIDMGNLVRDRFRINVFYKSLTDLITEIIKESETIRLKDGIVDLDKVDLYANALTMLCRLVQRTKPKVSSFYIIKGASHGNEPTVNELISYGIQEGMLYVLPECPIETSTYSVRYWKVLQCISAIASLPVSDCEKTSILSSFLNWKPSMNDFNSKCSLQKYDKAILEEFSDRTLLNVLSSELQSIRNDKERESLSDLIQFISSPRQLMKDKPCLGVTSTFKKWGDGQRNGKFTYSSGTGEASGIFVNGVLHLAISKESVALLHEVEKKLLEWLCQIRADASAYDQHLPFLNMLATTKNCSKRSIDGIPYTVKFETNEPKFLQLSKYCGKGECKIIKVKNDLLSVRKEVIKEIRAEPHMIWRANAISIVYDDETENVTYHHMVKEIFELVKLSASAASDRLSNIFYRDTRMTLSKISLQEQLYLSSVILLHCFFCHTLTSSIMEATSKSEILSRYFKHGRGTIIKSASKIQSHLLELRSSDINKNVTEEDAICCKLQQGLNKGEFSIDCWAEVQRILDENGFHRINVSVQQDLSQYKYNWIVEPEIGLGRVNDTGDLKDICYLLSSGIVPKVLIPYITDDKLFIDLIAIANKIKLETNKHRIDSKQFSAICCCVLYVFQTNEKVRNYLQLKITSLYQVVNQKEFLGSRGSLKFLTDGTTIQMQMFVKGITAEETREIESKKKGKIFEKNEKVKLVRSRVIAEMSGVFHPFEKIKEVKEFASGYEVRSESGLLTAVLFFTRLASTSTTTSKLLNFIDISNIPDTLQSLIIDLIMLLLGCEYKSYNNKSTSGEDTKNEHPEDQDITTDDIFNDDSDGDQENGSQSEDDYNIDDVEFEL